MWISLALMLEVLHLRPGLHVLDRRAIATTHVMSDNGQSS